MNLRVRDSGTLRNSFNSESIAISYATSISDLGSLRLGKFVLLYKYLFNLTKKLFLYKYSFVYFQISPHGTVFFRDLLFVLIIKLSRTRIVYHLHGKGIKRKAKNIFYKILYNFAFINQPIIVLSELLKYDIEDVHKGKVFVVPNGIPDINYRPKEITNANQPLRILFLSNLFLSKGILDFIDSISLLIANHIKVEGFIVGDEGDFKERSLKGLLLKKGLKKEIVFLGKKFGEEKMKILSTTDLLIYPTLEDCLPIVNLEAMQHGIPVIATREGAIPEIIDDGITGFLVDKNRPDQIAEKINLLYHDRKLLSQMGQAGRKKYEEKYTLEIFEQNMKTVFGKAIEN